MKEIERFWFLPMDEFDEADACHRQLLELGRRRREALDEMQGGLSSELPSVHG